MPDKLWKKAERKICEMLGGVRRGVAGRNDPDCWHEWLAVEVKCNKKMPAYLQEWMAQTWCNAEPGKLPLLVWHSVGDPYGDSLVVLKLKDFQDWFGDGDNPPVEHEAAALDDCERLPFDEVEFGEGGSQ